MANKNFENSLALVQEKISTQNSIDFFLHKIWRKTDVFFDNCIGARVDLQLKLSFAAAYTAAAKSQNYIPILRSAHETTSFYFI